MTYLRLLIWWFAIVTASDKVILFEYRDKESCNLIRNNYLKVISLPNQITSCMEKVPYDKRSLQEHS